MVDMRVEGGKKLALVAKALRHMGTDRTIVNEMSKRIRKSAPALRKAVKDSARAVLPKSGLFGAWVAAASIRVQVLRSERTAGVRLIVGRNSAHGRTEMARIDAGATRHPLYGNRKHWYPQRVTPGFATKVMDGPAFEQFQADTLDAIDAAVEQVLHGI